MTRRRFTAIGSGGSFPDRFSRGRTDRRQFHALPGGSAPRHEFSIVRVQEFAGAASGWESDGGASDGAVWKFDLSNIGGATGGWSGALSLAIPSISTRVMQDLSTGNSQYLHVTNSVRHHPALPADTHWKQEISEITVPVNISCGIPSPIPEPYFGMPAASIYLESVEVFQNGALIGETNLNSELMDRGRPIEYFATGRLGGVVHTPTYYTPAVPSVNLSRPVPVEVRTTIAPDDVISATIHFSGEVSIATKTQLEGNDSPYIPSIPFIKLGMFPVLAPGNPWQFNAMDGFHFSGVTIPAAKRSWTADKGSSTAWPPETSWALDGRDTGDSIATMSYPGSSTAVVTWLLNWAKETATLRVNNPPRGTNGKATWIEYWPVPDGAYPDIAWELSSGNINIHPQPGRFDLYGPTVFRVQRGRFKAGVAQTTGRIIDSASLARSADVPYEITIS